MALGEALQQQEGAATAEAGDVDDVRIDVEAALQDEDWGLDLADG